MNQILTLALVGQLALILSRCDSSAHPEPWYGSFIRLPGIYSAPAPCVANAATCCRFNCPTANRGICTPSASITSVNNACINPATPAFVVGTPCSNKMECSACTAPLPAGVTCTYQPSVVCTTTAMQICAAP